MPRRKPFSNKQKKQQLQDKRLKKREKVGSHSLWSGDSGSDEEKEQSEPSLRASLQEEEALDPAGVPIVTRLNAQPQGSIKGQVGVAKKDGRNRFCLFFEKESDKEIERRRRAARTTPITPVTEVEMEVGVRDVYGEECILEFPRRPPWSYSTTKAELLAQEEAAFAEFLTNIHSKYAHAQLSYFEHNLETWRQLWRVLEMSDVILLIADIRHPALHFSPALYHYVVEELKKKLILILNKVDLVPPSVGVAWRHYFLSEFPQLDVICFTSYPNKMASSSQPPTKVRLKVRRGCGKLPLAVGPWELLKLVEKTVPDKVNLDAWREKFLEITPTDDVITEDRGELEVMDEEDEAMEEEVEGDDDDEEELLSGITGEDESGAGGTSVAAVGKTKEDIVTIGMVGHPNVGKSSIINALMTKKMVSTSRTPGRTKHFQTLYLTQSLRLCDCPGLVFPSLVDKQLQILSGLYPVSQVREPYTAVGYLARRLPLIQLLHLQHPDQSCHTPKKTSGRRIGDFELEGVAVGGVSYTQCVTQEEEVWTAWDICDAWAYKRGYYTPKAARPDTYRAANGILRLAVDGRICMYYRPPGFSLNQEEWKRHPEVVELARMQETGISGGDGAMHSQRVDTPTCDVAMASSDPTSRD